MANGPQASARLPLGDFLAALSQRWQGLSREELLAVLVAHAERLPVQDRQALSRRPATSIRPSAPGRRARPSETRESS